MSSFNVDNLRVNAIDENIEQVSWMDDIMKGRWVSYEAVVCEKCGALMVLEGAGGDAEHHDLDSDAVLPPCTIGQHHGGLGPCENCTDADSHDGVGVCTCVDEPCDGYVPEAGGPVMNYFYPCPVNDPVKAAKEIAHLPLCVVEIDQSRQGFALCAGGMDLTWEICGAYVACGYLPPACFDLPRMGTSLTGWRRDVFEAMRRTLEIRANWAKNSLERLEELEAWFGEKNAERQTEEAD